MPGVTAARDVGLSMVPCIIREISDKDVLALQIQANAISLETKPAEYAHQIKRMMALDPDLTQSQVACLIRKSPSWVGSCLSLANLLKVVQVMVVGSFRDCPQNIEVRAIGSGSAAALAAEFRATGNRDRTARSWDIIVGGWSASVGSG